MQIQELQCPTDEIAAYVDGELDAALEMQMDLHFASCRACSVELNHQKEFLRNLDISLGHERELELPADFAKQVVANAESTVSGLRRPRERFNALFICAGLALFVLFAMGAEAGSLLEKAAEALVQTAAIGGIFGHLVYSLFIGLAIVVRSIAGQAQIGALAVGALVMMFSAFTLFISRRVLRTLKT
ncbi:MAG: zf-HC2 domain-containing protein [Pyrinomonadaceae bacterium]|nr:zf-HC2 domain-containing protein [Pyrinomonadaceae bacterium]